MKGHKSLTIFEYWELHKHEIARVRNWGTISRGAKEPMTMEERRDKYLRQCDRNMGILMQTFPDKPLENLTGFEMLAGVQKSKEIGGRVYSQSTLKSRLSLIRDILDFAEDRGDAINDLRWINDKRLEWYLEGVVLPPEERKKHFKKLAEKSRAKARSLTHQQQAVLVRTILENIKEDGRYLAIAVLLYTGMRPSECRGLNWGDLVPFESHSERHLLVVDRQRDDENNLVDRLKRPSSYRKIGAHFELEEIIKRRKEFVEKHLAEDEDIASCPMCCVGNDFKHGCTSAQLGSLATKILREVVRVQESVMTFCAVDMLAYEDGIESGGEDVRVSTYLLRHDAWTWMQASTELAGEEKRYIFGHSLFDGVSDRRAFFNNEDWIWEMLMKLDHTIKYLPLHESRLRGVLKVGVPHAVANTGVYTLHISPELLRAGGHVKIVLEANERDDPIVVKTLTSTKSIFVSKPMVLRATLIPCAREETYRQAKNMDYPNWVIRKHTRQTKEKEDIQPNAEDGCVKVKEATNH